MTEAWTHTNKVLPPQPPEASLLIAFYNNIPFLKLVLASLTCQSFKQFEVIICDDGSSEKTIEELHLLMSEFEFTITHSWHSDRGFCKNEALNRGIIHSTSNYLIFIDGDCILHPHFILDHIQNRELGRSLSGRRSDLPQSVSAKLTPELIKNGYLQKNWLKFLPSMFLVKDSEWSKGLRISHPLISKVINRKKRGLVGCNFSLHKEDIKKINGFDMSYTTPGTGEDSDVDARLQMIGITPKSIVNLGVQYHIYHKMLTRKTEDLDRLAETIRNNQFYAKNGLLRVSG